MRTSRIIAALGLAVAAASLSLAPAAGATSADPTYTTAALPPAPASGLTVNQDAEPGMGVDGNGVIWAASDINPNGTDPRSTGVLSGADVWKSTDGGQSFSWVAAPFNVAPNEASAGGEDTDLAVAPSKNANGFYNVYVASLWVGSTSLAISQDGGATWTIVPVNGVPVQDRPWLSVDGACVVYVTYHAIAPYDTVIDKVDLCNPADQGIGSAVDPTQTATFLGNIAPGLSNRFGKPVVDNSPTSPHQHRLYAPMMGCDSADPTSGEVAIGCTTDAKIFVGVTDDGVTYTDHVVADTHSTDVYIWPDTIATDAAGNVYLAWFDGQHSYLDVSKDGGTTWSPPVQINAAPALSTAYPTVAANKAGEVDVAFYGADRDGKTDDVNVMGKPNDATGTTGANATPAAVTWNLYLAKSTDGGATFSQAKVAGPVHTGTLCTSGGGCGTYAGDRNLLDDFGLVIDPATDQATSVFDNDQPGGTIVHTDFVTEDGAVGNPLPEAPSTALLAVVGALGVGLVLRRARRARRA